ncbi:telomeric repeat-binding factor 2-like isoform X2 [Antedon mediterranea]|uniref:telomeric repeat-binding factor 2-like isoform X2 n=1 Tax=Antedon mediterranea TaxID=105859 RepID=UPI003AF5A7ED
MSEHFENTQIWNWILEFVCKRMHREFINSSTVDDVSDRRFLNGFCKYIEAETEQPNVKMRLLKYIHLLTQLSDGASTQSHSDSGLTTLEDAMHTIEEMMQFDVDGIISDETIANLKQLIRKEAVLVWCRNNDFIKAEEVFTNCWEKDVKVDEETKSILRDVIKSHRRTHIEIRNKSYKDFLQETHQYLEVIYSTFDEPFLIKADRKFNQIITSSKTAQEDNSVCRKRKPKKKCFSTDAQLICKRMSEHMSQRAGVDQDIMLSDIKRNEKLHIANVTRKVQSEKDQKDVMSDCDIFDGPSTSGNKRQKRSEDESDKNETEDSRIKQKRTMNKPGTTESKSRPLRIKLRRTRPLPFVTGAPGDQIKWDDDEEEEEVEYPNLATPKVRRSLNLKPKRNIWKAGEVTELRLGVRKYGEGNWAKILRNSSIVNRSAVDLKDKWRNMQKKY